MVIEKKKKEYRPKVTLKVLEQRRRELVAKSTPSERIFKKRLEEAGVCFEFQYVMSPYIVDFFIPFKKLVVEIDGEYHESKEQREYDKKRTRYLRKQKIKVLRIKNSFVETFDLKRLEAYADLVATQQKPRKKIISEKSSIKKFANKRAASVTKRVRSTYKSFKSVNEIEEFHAAIFVFLDKYQQQKINTP